MNEPPRKPGPPRRRRQWHVPQPPIELLAIAFGMLIVMSIIKWKGL